MRLACEGTDRLYRGCLDELHISGDVMDSCLL